jgi:hypothetical protein
MRNENIILTQEQIEILNGLLLGDGSLHRYGENRNASLIVERSGKGQLRSLIAESQRPSVVG